MQNPDKMISTAVERLNTILPLTARHRALDAPLQQLHKALLSAYVDLGRSLTRQEMSLQVDDIDEAVKILEQEDLVVFDGRGEPVGAYPFTMEKREHRVAVNSHVVHCMCALDALAVSPMFNVPVTITSHCHVTSMPVRIQQNVRKIDKGGDASDVWFGIDWSAASGASCCAHSLCTEMIFLHGEAVANSWCGEASEQRQIFCLSEAVDFAARFFVPVIYD